MIQEEGLVVYSSQIHHAVLGLIGLIILAYGILLMTRASSAAGLGLVASGLILSVVSVMSFFDRKPVIRISREGLWTRNGPLETIPWNTITSTKIKTVPRAGKFLVIYQDESQIDIPISGLDKSAGYIHRTIQEWLALHNGHSD